MTVSRHHGTNKRVKKGIRLPSIIEGKEEMPCSIVFVKSSMKNSKKKMAESLTDM